MVPGAAGKEKQGPFFGKLTRFIQRLEAKKDDKRIGFLFQVSDDELQLNWLNDLCSALMHGSELNGKKAGVKILYGVEANIVDDGVPIAYNEEHIELTDATYVVFDVETTGLSAVYDTIIELAAVKMHKGNVI